MSSKLFTVGLGADACGGPGTVVASVAFDAGIFNGPFFTRLVLVAIFPGHGRLAEYVLEKGWNYFHNSPTKRSGRIGN